MCFKKILMILFYHIYMQLSIVLGKITYSITKFHKEKTVFGLSAYKKQVYSGE